MIEITIILITIAFLFGLLIWILFKRYAAQKEEIESLEDHGMMLLIQNKYYIDDALVLSDSVPVPYSGPSTNIVPSSQVAELSDELEEAHSAAFAEMLYYTVDEVLSVGATAFKTANNKYEYSFGDSPDYAEAAAHLPVGVKNFSIYVDGDLNEWRTISPKTELSISLSVNFIDGTDVALHTTIHPATDSSDSEQAKPGWVMYVADNYHMNKHNGTT